MNQAETLSNCLLEGDAGARNRARRRALLLSVSFEAAVIFGLLLWPLLVTANLPARYVVTPIPPFRGRDSGERRNASDLHSTVRRRSSRTTPILEPPTIRRRFAPTTSDAAPDLNSLINDSAANGPGPATGIPGVPGSTETETLTPHPSRPPEKNSSRPLMISAGVMEASLIHRIEPAYPPLAKAMRLQGAVRLRAIIATDGSIRDLAVLSGNPILAQAALVAVRQWRYRPTQLDGAAVEVETYITVNFVM